MELWLLAKASDAPATYWAHQSAFVSLVSHCIIRTKGPATHTPTALLCPVLAFPNSFPPSHCPSLRSPFIPLLPSPPLGFHHPSQHATYSGCSWWLVTLPSLTFTFITSKLRRSFSFLPFPSLYFLISLSTPGLRLGEIPFQHVFMTESKGRVNGASVGAGLCEARTWSSCTAGVEQSPRPFSIACNLIWPPSSFYLTEELELLTLPISDQIPSPLTFWLIHFQSGVSLARYSQLPLLL